MPSPQTESWLGFIVCYLKSKFYQDRLWGPPRGRVSALLRTPWLTLTGHSTPAIVVSRLSGSSPSQLVLLSLSEQLQLACAPPSRLTQPSVHSDCRAHAPPRFAFSVLLCKTCLPMVTCWLLPGGLKAPSPFSLERQCPKLQTGVSVASVLCCIQKRGGMAGVDLHSSCTRLLPSSSGCWGRKPTPFHHHTPPQTH